jgi:hypothetical protein
VGCKSTCAHKECFSEVVIVGDWMTSLMRLKEFLAFPFEFMAYIFQSWQNNLVENSFRSSPVCHIGH